MNALPDSAADTFTLNGSLTIYRAVELRELLMLALARKGDVLLDLGEVEEIDLAGVQLLLLAQREARELGKALAWGPQSEAVREALLLAGLAGEMSPAAPAALAQGGL